MDAELPIRIVVLHVPAHTRRASLANRFIYLNSGTMAGQHDSCFTRRAKIKTGGITWTLVEQALAEGGIVETQIEDRYKRVSENKLCLITDDRN